MQIFSRLLLQSSGLALLVAAGSVTAQAAPSSAIPPAFAFSGVTPADSATLKHLPAGPDEMVFRGEASTKRFDLNLSRGELDAMTTFRLAFQNTVAALPDRSNITLRINGRVLATIPARSSNGLSTVSVPIPAGVLVPGLNAVELSSTMSHRVDCSVPATYELWTLIDPAKTGFVLPASASAAVRTIADIASEPLADDGTTRIHLRLPNTTDADTIRQGARFIDALVARVGLRRPIVDVGADAGKGAGFDVMLAHSRASAEAVAAMRILAREDGMTLARDPSSGRLALIVTSIDDADLEAQVAAFVAKDSPQPPGAAGPTLIDGETRRSFADLGLRSDDFSGRHFSKSLEIALPSDFYPANYDKARLLIDGAYATDLEPDSNLVFRVNGTLVSSLRLGPDRGGVLKHEIVELPLRFFRPGPNVIAVEGTTHTRADQQCDPTVMSNGVRLTLADSSELEFPSFAHLGTTPQLPGAMASLRAPSQGSSLNVYLAETDQASIGAGLTILANMASTGRSMPPPDVRFGIPSELDAPGVVVSPLGALPAMLATSVRARLAPVDNRTAGSDDNPSRPSSDRRLGASNLWTEVSQGRLDTQDLIGRAQRALRSQGFFFGSDGVSETLPFASGSLMIAAVDPRIDTRKLVGVEVPRFTSDPAQWLVVTAGTDLLLQSGLTRLVADGQWKDLRGQAVSLDVEKGRLTAVQPPRVNYVMPNTIVMSDLRPIMGGIFSNNIQLSLVVLTFLMSLLGLSTHVLIRRAGAK
ncbi:MAG: cellulose biosynthesis cyclic di-GMP-binding regulatory protein BcsB [Janthinobacterium lividum]